MKAEILKNDPDLDMLRTLWLQSFNIRRLFIRELTVTEILEHFPGYCLPEMVSAVDNSLLQMYLKRNTYTDNYLF